MSTSACAIDREWNIVAESDNETIVNQCNLVHTVTYTRDAVIKTIPKRDTFLHITCVGADTVGKQELSMAVLEAADFLVCDSVGQSRERGEFQRMDCSAQIVEIGSLLNNPRLIPRDSRISVFDTTGMAAQDIMIARLLSSLVLTSNK